MNAKQRTGHNAKGSWKTGPLQRAPAATQKEAASTWSIEVKERKPSSRFPVRVAGCSTY